MLEDFMEHARASGWAREHRLEADDFGRSTRLIIDTGYTLLNYSISEHELRMGGPDELRRWLEIIGRDLRREFQRRGTSATAGPPRSTTATEIRMRQDEYMRRWSRESARFDRELFEALAQGTFGEPRDPAADKRAAELFRMTAGDEAFKTLEAGKALPITGSKGTAYHLLKKASYCVERPSDGARLCAVVPGVPLWDHLLGVKLMVEHDEPRFLKTANVAGIGPAIYPGGITWVDDRERMPRW
jgi:hypothetical protein